MLRWLVEAIEEVGSTFHFLVDEHHGVSHTIHDDGVEHTVELHDPSETILVTRFPYVDQLMRARIMSLSTALGINV
jgi:hypothetical protein